MKLAAFINFLAVLILLPHMTSAAVEAPRNPDSAKECAICHYRWVDTFFIDGRGSDLVDFESEKVVATPGMCFSCHDGSVADSRARVYNDFRHKINEPPSKEIQIPKIFPLDEQGNMQCFTCHTAHGVPSEMGIAKTIFIRTSNENSEMCAMCHKSKDGGVITGNHPLGSLEKRIPSLLISHGAKTGERKDHIICETCHTVHGSPNESFLIESARNSQLCLECHSDKKIFDKDGKRNHQHVINVKPVKVKIPQEVLKRGGKLGNYGEIICQTCHKIHDNNIEKKLLLILKDENSSLCLTCHADKKYIIDTKHNLIHSAPDERNLQGKTVAEAGVCSACHLPHNESRETSGEGDFITKQCLSCHRKGNIADKVIPAEYRHPLDVHPFDQNNLGSQMALKGIKRDDLTIPLFNKNGMQDTRGVITCTTCHDPHRWRADSIKGEIGKEAKGNSKTSFLRKSSPEICKECHVSKFYVKATKHNINKFFPEIKNKIGQTPSESGLCGVCHLVHGGQKGYLWAREIITTSGNVVQDLCVGCHNEKSLGKEKVIRDHSHPVNVSPYDKGMTTTLPLFDENGDLSDRGMMTCETCHDPHRWDPVMNVSGNYLDIEGNVQNSFLRLANYPSPDLCENCHSEQRNVEGTDHDLNITAPEAVNIAGQTPSESGTCGVCHLVHNSPNKLKLWAQSFARGSSVMDRMCNACHSTIGSGKAKVPQVDSHPEGQLITNAGRDLKDKIDYFPLFDQFTGENVSTGNISCPSCHDVHQWDPRVFGRGEGINIEGSASNSFLRAQTYNLLCIDCHGLDALFRFKYYHDPEERIEKLQRLYIPQVIY